MSELITITDPKKAETKPRTPRVRKREPGPRPDWLTVKYVRTETYETVVNTKEELGLVTVYEEARCPNRHECWSAGTATFMLMGDICTRRCGFCAVAKGKPRDLDPQEPEKTGIATAKLGVKHAVITSVNRDELADGGAEHFAETVKAIKRHSPETRIELLVPDFLGDRAAMDVVLDAGPHVVAHNMETVPRLYRRVRPQAIYQRSLDCLRHIAEREDVICKTGMMLGLGETDEEVEDVMWAIRDTGCEILSLGQFLSPTVKHLAVERWVTPDTFARLAEIGRSMGFRYVESGPMVRSSYMAHRPFESAEEEK